MRRFLLFTCLFPLALVAQAKSQQWYCDAGGAAAESMARSFEQSDFRPEHLNNPFQRSIAEHVVACSESASRPGETLRDCVVRLCMGKTTALGRGSLRRVHISPAGAAMVTDEQAASIYAAAYGQYGGALPERAPTIHVVPAAKLHELAGCNHCAIRALHQDGHIYADDTLDFSNPYHASILLHEMVHYLQYRALGPAQSCEEWLAREEQAYVIQARVLLMAHQDSRPVVNAHRQLIGLRPCRPQLQ